MNKMKKFLIGLLIFTTYVNAIAKDIPLYDQPAPQGKVVGKIDLANGIIPIINNKSGDWMKVADPANGNVGWVKTTDVKSNEPVNMIYTQQYYNSGGTPTTPQAFQINPYGPPKKLTKEESQAMLLEYQRKQQEAQNALQDLMNKMSEDFGNKGQWPVPQMPQVLPSVGTPGQQVTVPVEKPITPTTAPKQ